MFWSTMMDVDFKILKLLIDYGADVNLLDKFNTNAFSRLLNSFDLSKAEYLLNCNISHSINAIDTINGNKVLASSIWILHKHLNHGKDKVPICINIAKKLIALGTDMYSVNYAGNSAIHVATKSGCYETVKILIEEGVEVNTIGARGLAPIHILSEQESFTDFDQANRPFLNLRAMINGNIEESNMINESDKNKTAKYIEDAMIDCLHFLLSRGADINLCNNAGDSCLHIACGKVGYKFKKAIIECGAAINSENVAGSRTSLHVLLDSRNLLNSKNKHEIIYIYTKLLMENGADINLRCNR